jgi:hypothetical protein
MFLYHVNLGFPLIQAGSRYLVNSRETKPRDADAAPHLATWAEFPAPTPDQVEWVYYHDLATAADGTTMVGFANRVQEGGAMGIYLKYDKGALPYFIEWKMPAEGTYVTGLEPANCLVEGRAKDRREGRLKVLKPGESVVYDLEIGVLTRADEVAAIADEIKSMK